MRIITTKRGYTPIDSRIEDVVVDEIDPGFYADGGQLEQMKQTTDSLAELVGRLLKALLKNKAISENDCINILRLYGWESVKFEDDKDDEK
jgi:hypothetical protein